MQWKTIFDADNFKNAMQFFFLEKGKLFELKKCVWQLGNKVLNLINSENSSI